MDSTPVTKTDGATDAFHTEYKNRRTEVYSLRNYLKRQFELYETMKIDHTITFGKIACTYACTSKKFHVLVDGSVWRDFRKITDMAWELHRCGIRNPNTRKEWISTDFKKA